MPRNTEDGGGSPYLGWLVALFPETTRDLEGLISARERRVIFREFVRTRGVKCAYASEKSRTQDPFYPILLRNDFNWFYNEHYAEDGEIINLPKAVVDELLVGLRASSLLRAAAEWPDVDPDHREQAFTDAVMHKSGRLIRTLRVYRVFSETGQKYRTFTNYFAVAYDWAMVDLLRKEKRECSIGGEWIEYVDPEIMRLYSDQHGENPRKVTERLERYRAWIKKHKEMEYGGPWFVLTGISRKPEFFASRAYLRWLAKSRGPLCPRIQTYFNLVLGEEQPGEGQNPHNAACLLTDRILHQLVCCLDERMQQAPRKDGKLLAFLVEKARNGMLEVPSSKVAQLLREFARFSARRVRCMARHRLEQAGGDAGDVRSVFGKTLGAMIDELQDLKDEWIPDVCGLYSYVATRSNMTVVDAAALETFRRGVERTYSRHPAFKTSLLLRLLKELGFDADAED